MTGSHPDDEGQAHVSIHWDGSAREVPATETGLDLPEDELPPRSPFLLRHRYSIGVVVALAALLMAGYVLGNAIYHPSPRLPALSFETADALYGVNADVAAELDVVRETFSPPESLALTPTGSVFRMPLPRTFGDRLFGERDEVALVFTAKGPAGENRFLSLSGAGKTIYAIEAPLGLSGREQPAGVFLALDSADPALGKLAGVLEALKPALADRPVVEVSSERLYVFGPYGHGDVTALRERIEGSTVMSFLADGIEAAGGSVSVAAPVILVAGGPSRGTINGIYHPSRRVIMEPLWGASSTTTLAHELTHAYLDTVVADRQALLSRAADYLERSHPVLYGEVVSDLYERLGREGRAEESLAFIVGAIAAGQTKTVSTQRLLENTGNLAISEAILYSDVGFLAQVGLLPPCMFPAEGATGELEQSFFDEARIACGSDD